MTNLQDTYDRCSNQLTELFLALDDEIALEQATDALDEEFTRDSCTHDSLQAVTKHWMNHYPDEL